jgi:hypothetical protein
VGEEARARGKREKRGTASGDTFLWRLGGAGGEEKGRGSGSVPRGAGEGAEMGGRGATSRGAGTTRARRLWAARVATCDTRRAGAAGDSAANRGGGGRATRAQQLTSGRDDVGARWAAVGCGRVRQCGAVLTRGPGSTVPLDSVLN